MAVEVKITYEGELHCTAVHTPSGSLLKTDAPVDNGGKGEFFSPTDLVATALGTCIATTLGLYAQKKGLDITGTEITVLKEMVSTPARRIGSLKVKVIIPKGQNFSDEQQAKFETIAKTCPVGRSLHPDVNVTIQFVYPK
ncbi:MAG: OsmC family protein [Planctomycetota bacterium]|nr:OsmC family protein [Planctomycetota bacterium]